MKPLIKFVLIFGLVCQSLGFDLENLEPHRTDDQESTVNLRPPTLQSKRTCRNVNPGKTSLCGNRNKNDDRCLYACVAGGFYNGMCGKTKECFCYRNNPEKGFIIEKRNPVMRKLKAKPSGDTVDAKTEQNPKEITLVTDDYTTGYVDVDVNINLEWDLTYLSEWFQSFNFYNNLKCDPCLCPAGCAIYGYFSGFCTPGAASECMCATAAKKPI